MSTVPPSLFEVDEGLQFYLYNINKRLMLMSTRNVTLFYMIVNIAKYISYNRSRNSFKLRENAFVIKMLKIFNKERADTSFTTIGEIILVTV